MIFEFLDATNGCIMRIVHDELDDSENAIEEYITYQSSESEEDENRVSFDRFVDFLYQIKESFGPPESRYSKHRVEISLVKGDKFEAGVE